MALGDKRVREPLEAYIWMGAPYAAPSLLPGNVRICSFLSRFDERDHAEWALQRRENCKTVHLISEATLTRMRARQRRAHTVRGGFPCLIMVRSYSPVGAPNDQECVEVTAPSREAATEEWARRTLDQWCRQHPDRYVVGFYTPAMVENLLDLCKGVWSC